MRLVLLQAAAKQDPNHVHDKTKPTIILLLAIG